MGNDNNNNNFHWKLVENCEDSDNNNQILINVMNDKSISSHRLCGVKQLVKSMTLRQS